MNAFYSFLIIAGLVGCIVGYTTGMIKLLSFITSVIIATGSALFITPYAVSFLQDHFILDKDWAIFILLLAGITICFIAYRLVQQLLEYFFRGKQSKLRRTGGILLGGCTALLLFTAGVYTLKEQLVPEQVLSALRLSLMDDIKNEYEAAQENFFPGTNHTQVMAAPSSGAGEKAVSVFGTGDFRADDRLENQMLLLLNDDRTEKGLHPLYIDTALVWAARLHAADMLRRGYFAHDTPEGINPFQRLKQLNIHYRVAGENLAKAATVIAAYRALMQSPGHRANMMNPAFRKVGIGVQDAGTRGVMVAQEFSD